MKEFIDKLIARLEERKTDAIDKWDGGASHRAYSKSIEIVNELAEEMGVAKNAITTWIPCSERLPEEDGKQYMVQKTNGLIDILEFTKDAYKLDKYDFVEYKGKKKQLFYDYDSEYGFIEYECEAWQPLPPKYEPKGE